MPNKPNLKYFKRESAKNAEKTFKRNLERNFKHMTIVFDSNNFNTILYTKYCCVQSFMQNKPSLNYFM